MSNQFIFLDPTSPGYGIAASPTVSGPIIFHTSDYGANWAQTTSSINGPFNSVYRSGNKLPSALAATTQNGLYYSSDGGITWLPSNITTGGFNSVFLYGQYAVATSNSSSSSYPYYGVVYSNNYGQTWTQAQGLPAQTYYGVFITASSTGYVYAVAAGQSGLYCSVTNTAVSQDVGASWTLVQGTSGNTFFAVAASTDINNAQYAIATSTTGGVWSSQNFGQTFSQCPTLSSGNFSTLAFSSPYALVSSSSDTNPCLYYSSDYGQTWTQNPNATSNFGQISMVGQTALLSSQSPYMAVYSTTNYGQNLSVLTSSEAVIQGATALVQDGSGPGLRGCTVGENFACANSNNPTVGSSWVASGIVVSDYASAQGTMTVTSSVSTSSKSTTNNNLVTNTYTATATGSGTGETYDKALEAAAKASLDSLVKVLYETARQESPGPIVSSALVTATKAPRNNN